jgi:hypothetical protein
VEDRWHKTSEVRCLGHRESREELIDLASGEVPRERDREFGISTSRVSGIGNPSAWGHEWRDHDKDRGPDKARESQH